MMREPPKHQQKLSHGRQPKKAPTKNVKAEEQRQDWNSGSRKKFAIFLYSFACCPLPSVSTNSSPSNSTVAPTVVAGSQGAEAVEATDHRSNHPKREMRERSRSKGSSV